MSTLLQESIYLIHQKLKKRSTITLSELQIIGPISHIETLQVGEYFIRAGESAQKIALTIKGLAKTFYVLDNGKEIINQFGSEGSFLGVYTDLLKGVPSSGYVQAIEPCTLLVMNYQEMLSVTENSLPWAHLLRMIAEDTYIAKSDKDRNVSLKTAQEKYDYFQKTYPDLIGRVPSNQIALYLNITPATLSRLKNSSGNYRNKC